MSEISLGRYLFERLYQLEVQTIFGLPGDFNLSLLDKIYEVEDVHGKGSFRWAGNANELNAAYAADGYARLKRISCLVTTFGVGELSALNGVAGAYAEHIGLIHVVGVPSISSQSKQLLLHHTLGNGDFTVFHRMSTNISQTTAFISDLATAPKEIDRVIRTAYTLQRPVYLGLPANMVDLTVPASLLDTPIDLSLEPNDSEAQEEVIETILTLVRRAENPIILVDACAARHDCKPEVKQLVELTQFPVFVTPMGKGTVDEGGVSGDLLSDDPQLISKITAKLAQGKTVASRFGGVYIGTLSKPEVKEAVEQADLIISAGALLSDFNTGSFSYSYGTKNVIEFHSDHTKIRQAIFPGVKMKELLQQVISRIGPVVKGYKPKPVPKIKMINTPAPKTASLTQEWLWTKVSSWFQEGDVIISETGTSAFGIPQTRFPNDVVGISQVLWGSIGYSVGATLGAVMAAQEINPDKRVILFVGDGSLQLTVQEISTMIRHGTTPYLFVLNNDGYTIERLIHGENAGYNDIQPWKNLELLNLFNAKDYESIRISTIGEAEAIFSDKKFAKNSKIRLIEVMLPRMDAPQNLVRQAEITAKTNEG
ncbi:pyruvate decarboxylase [Spathaspora passalidarum NRRL Y-27907]|uniref:Pyruvate decarboxylase n=1 Tax=Spathaspora passalidarum (strain NRRL Y-27907 / 11-Y1) TaxID=619300 RepID=G3AGU2_SPAPN|nr:pyruvate decarboxylase [Spathaspora passalidarum NRRL Y-27907]EGW35425.1 pyruvate decarboxylase [Spathaspora passalidarum NRRL Y-27907]